jgi:Raf kinase inhibitor-like YbhB/YbcL family protein
VLSQVVLRFGNFLCAAHQYLLAILKEVKLLKKLIIRSSAFEDNKRIPAKYTCDGDDVNPPLTIEGTPEETKSLVLIIDDPDASAGTWNHWLVWDIPPATRKIRENTVPGTEGVTTSRKRAYGGPCPPSGTHRYLFRVYALDRKLNLNPNSLKKDVEKAMEGHILAEGELLGLYRRT